MNTPLPNVMYGLTHAPSGAAIIREPRVLKVQIGVPKGRAIYVYKYGGEWVVRFGEWKKEGGKDKLVMLTWKGATRKEAEAFYGKIRHTAAISNRPMKLPFFTFTKRRVVEEGGKQVEVYEPDFDAIDAHGEVPKEIDIVLMSEEPWQAQYALWSATKLQCYGDGVDAMRLVKIGNNSPEWKEAQAAGQERYPFGPCATNGCPQYGVECKPSGVLSFQLASAMRLGATAYYTTTGIVSIMQIFSALERFRSLTDRVNGSIVGIPLKLVLSNFKANHNGIPSLQPCVSIEMRAESLEKLRRLMLETAFAPGRQQPRLTAAVVAEDVSEIEAPAMAAEFYPDASEPEYEDAELGDDAAVAPAMAAATDKKAEGLADRLKGARQKQAEVVEQKPEPVAPVAQQAGAVVPPPVASPTDPQDLF